MPNFAATTPIYYVTAKPHLGHAYTTIVTDAVCRWHRLCGDNVHLLTGTDEHGLKVQQYADAAGKTPREFVDEIAPLYADAWKRLDVKYDDFIRTTEERIHKTPANYVEEENYFFRLSRFEQRLLDWYDKHPDAIVPDFRRNEVLGFIKGGLNDFSVSRKSLKWGIPLPWNADHVAYVWFDALANYITAHGYGSDAERFASRWPVDWHFIGKDIIRFHCVYWPAMLMSAGLEPPKGWAVGGFLLVGGEKMSKTTGNVVSPLDLIDEFGVDGFRYYVLADTAYGNDGDFTYEGLTARYNSDLANNLGNLAARVATVVEKKCGGIGPTPRSDSPLAEVAAAAVRDADAAWRAVQPSKALDAAWNLIRATNAHLEQNEPWKMAAGAAVDAVMGDALEALRIVVLLANPALPSTTQEIWRRIGLPGRIEDRRLPSDAAWGGYPGGLTVEKGEPLFPRKKS
ncbi:MAG: methionine--tRNA ligase [Actinobacteria bacterium]|nr:methionine--tRNA ligase [Actinomycetota bacterium]